MTRSCLLLFAAVLVGCGPPAEPTGTVSGTVTLDGEPFEGDVMVMLFDTSTGKGGTAEVGEGGTFAFDEPLPVGKYTVYLTPTPQPPPEDGSPPPALKIDKRVPDKYWNEVGTDLSTQVEEGANDVAVAMKS